MPINEPISVMRHESTFLTLDQTAVDRRFEMPFLKTYDYSGEFINRQHSIGLRSPARSAYSHDFNDPRNPDTEASDYGVYQGVLEDLDPRSFEFEFWGIYGCTGLFRRVA